MKRRIFLALPLPERLRTRLYEEVAHLKSIGASVAWVEPERYHLTLRFFGEIDEEALLELHPILEEVLSNSGTLRLVACGLSAIPDRTRPRVILCGVKGEDPTILERFLTLKRRLEGRLRSAGWHKEKGEYLPHITLGRVRGERSLATLSEALGPGERREFGHFEAKSAVLYESFVGSEGRRYLDVKTIFL